MTNDEKRNEGMFSGNSVNLNWNSTLPNTSYKTPLQEIGIVREGMTGREVYEASKAYWADFYANRAVRRTMKYTSKPLVAGCNCDGAGWYYLDVVPSDYRYKVLQRCECTANRNGEAFRQALQAFSEDTFDTFDVNRPVSDYKIGTHNVPADYQKKSIMKAYTQLSNDDFANKMSYYVWGNVGSGKSHLARAWAIRFADMGYSVVYRHMPTLVDEMRTSVKNNGVDILVDKLINCDILVIDDIGAEEDQSDWVRGRFLRIVDGRNGKKTVYTSNIEPSDLYNRMDERVADRINQCQRLWLPLQSYRSILRERK
jgi:DNA replication protein DnaC